MLSRFSRAILPAVLSVQAWAGDTAWQIHLDRRPAVGDRWTVSANGTQERGTVTNAPGQPKEISVERLEVTYTAIHEILARDAEGRPTGVLLRVDRLITNDGSGPMEQLPPGTLITARSTGDHTTYQLGRDFLQGTLSDALDLAGAKLPSGKEPSEDGVFQNFTPRQPGAEWTAHPQRLADAIAATSAFLIDRDASSATLRFDGPATENNIPVLATTTTFKVVPVSLRHGGAGQRLMESHITSTTERRFPIDPALPLVRESVSTDMKLLQKSNPGPRATTTETTLKRQVTRRCLPLAIQRAD